MPDPPSLLFLEVDRYPLEPEGERYVLRVTFRPLEPVPSPADEPAAPEYGEVNHMSLDAEALAVFSFLVVLVAALAILQGVDSCRRPNITSSQFPRIWAANATLR